MPSAGCLVPACFTGENSVASMETDTTLLTIRPSTWDARLSARHSVSASKFFQWSAAGPRPSCKMM